MFYKKDKKSRESYSPRFQSRIEYMLYHPHALGNVVVTKIENYPLVLPSSFRSFKSAIRRIKRSSSGFLLFLRENLKNYRIDTTDEISVCSFLNDLITSGEAVSAFPRKEYTFLMKELAKNARNRDKRLLGRKIIDQAIGFKYISPCPYRPSKTLHASQLYYIAKEGGFTEDRAAILQEFGEGVTQTPPLRVLQTELSTYFFTIDGKAVSIYHQSLVDGLGMIDWEGFVDEICAFGEDKNMFFGKKMTIDSAKKHEDTPKAKKA